VSGSVARRRTSSGGTGEASPRWEEMGESSVSAKRVDLVLRIDGGVSPSSTAVSLAGVEPEREEARRRRGFGRFEGTWREVSGECSSSLMKRFGSSGVIRRSGPAMLARSLPFRLLAGLGVSIGGGLSVRLMGSSRPFDEPCLSLASAAASLNAERTSLPISKVPPCHRNDESAGRDAFLPS
jgi:hypothetical protein